ncbi:undecaprenyldiphospho-muramoylpentapeptide beta-N-acetylglucosaminyltransferase [Breoghania sp. L-A4]|uniref:undecaprenyldiphospho-muramoylpentapeptide beta-N-acetylglucosaminyltransferase n=1 Tax=Breoghania sp. L-A4 TaxID=2304600 RepID=UPI000E35E844|nr:undecaprenyldiphospho-muramoylpentapeptide beta-N-acetylglucosaminyltransferase [Breoghania sp. L-A4]AXS41333.1 undecaprenyldiphospho-muramoylpentapeptide beta-N-acetylglucosaminyltransferase [Breoghania sp. L-A4]
MDKTVLLSAGGTGGHLFPAQALATALGKRGWTVELATDERADQYGQVFPARAVHIVSSETIRSKNPLALARTGLKLFRGFLQASRVVKRIRPSVVVGFGGYPTFPPLAAALRHSVPTILHEQNAVMGRANRLLARGVSVIAKSFGETRGLEAYAGKAALTGNPLREAVIAAAETPYDAPSANGALKLLVFGGSQGARFFSDLLPAALAETDADVRARIVLAQQCRPEDLERVRAAYEGLGVQAELASFFGDLPARIAQSHLVVCRSGATSVCELAAIGRPSILVPLPHALDQDQSANAAVLEHAGGAWPIAQKDLTPSRLAREITDLMTHPERLSQAAMAARAQGRPDAVERLADLVEHVAQGGSARDFDKGVRA